MKELPFNGPGSSCPPASFNRFRLIGCDEIRCPGCIVLLNLGHLSPCVLFCSPLEECPGRGSHLTRARALLRDAWATNCQKTVTLCADQPPPAQLMRRVLNSAAQRGSIRTRGLIGLIKTGLFAPAETAGKRRRLCCDAPRVIILHLCYNLLICSASFYLN